MAEQNSSAKSEPMSASGAPDFAQDAPVSLADRIRHGGHAEQNDAVGKTETPNVMSGTGDPYNLVKEG